MYTHLATVENTAGTVVPSNSSTNRWQREIRSNAKNKRVSPERATNLSLKWEPRDKEEHLCRLFTKAASSPAEIVASRGTETV